MDIAIVTGASSSLGLAISRRLLQLGFRVYGLGGDYSKCPLNNVNFKPVSCDLADPDAVENAAKNILEKEKGVFVLVNNAKYFGRNDYMEMDNREMEQILKINLLCPLVLARTLANSLMQLQGFLIQLGSPHAETSRGGAVGAAASGGLKWMGDVLFHDLRHEGVKVCHLSPEPNRGRDPRSLARPGARLESTIDPEAVAQAIEQILQSPFGNIVTEMVLRPLRVKEPEHEPVIRLPRPNPKPVPYTVPREMIEAEEQLDDEEFEKNQRDKRQKRRSRKTTGSGPKDKLESGNKPENQTKDQPEDKDQPQGKGKPQDNRNDRNDRNDNRRRGQKKPAQKPDNQRSHKPSNQSSPEKTREERSKDNRNQENAKDQPRTQDQPPAQDKPRERGGRRRSRRKPKPPMTQVGFLQDKEKQEAQKPHANRQDKSQEAPAKPADKSAEAKPEQKAPVKKKTAAKKTARKATTKKTAAKKAPAKKTARKAVKKTAAKKSAPRKRTTKKEPESGESKSG